MQNNSLGVVLTIASVVVASLCCLSGAGVAGWMMLRPRAMDDGYGPVQVAPTVQSPMPVPPSVGPVVPTMPSTTPTMPELLTVLPTSPVRGPQTAPVTMHILSDFQCPFCGRVVPTVHELMQTYEGRVRFVWHDYPLPFHQDAMPAAEAAQEVRRQLGDEAFWRFHDALFENQRDLSRPSLERLASEVPGLDVSRFRQALDTHEHEATIRGDIALADAAHPTGLGTPSFSVNGRWISGAQPSDAFHEAIDAALVGH